MFPELDARPIPVNMLQYPAILSKAHSVLEHHPVADWSNDCEIKAALQNDYREAVVPYSIGVTEVVDAMARGFDTCLVGIDVEVTSSWPTSVTAVRSPT